MTQFTKFDAEAAVASASGGDGGAPTREGQPEREPVLPSEAVAVPASTAGFNKVADLVLALATVESLSPATPEQITAAQCLRNVLASVNWSSPAAAAASTAAVLACYAEGSSTPSDVLAGVSAVDLAEHVARLATAPSARSPSPPPLQEEVEPPIELAPPRAPNGAVGERKPKRERKPRKKQQQQQQQQPAAVVEPHPAAMGPVATSTANQFSSVDVARAPAPQPTFMTNGVASAAVAPAPAPVVQSKPLASGSGVSVIEFMGPSVIEAETTTDEEIAAAAV